MAELMRGALLPTILLVFVWVGDLKILNYKELVSDWMLIGAGRLRRGVRICGMRNAVLRVKI
ncbi:hypothetical protein [Celeribacter halophilus]|uniref:hypothetical protein n=1 Tax=Celeribacter halophilus TaxID=576117 RepID=UPI003A8EF317